MGDVLGLFSFIQNYSADMIRRIVIKSLKPHQISINFNCILFLKSVNSFHNSLIFYFFSVHRIPALLIFSCAYVSATHIHIALNIYTIHVLTYVFSLNLVSFAVLIEKFFSALTQHTNRTLYVTYF